VTGEIHLHGLGIVGDEFQADIAVLGCPSRRDAADEQRIPRRKAMHPSERLLPLAPQVRRVSVAAEQSVVLGERGFDLFVRGQCGRVGQHQLPKRLALGEGPVGEAVLDDEPGRDLGDTQAIPLPAEAVPATVMARAHC
jgi:hypothetical protein